MFKNLFSSIFLLLSNLRTEWAKVRNILILFYLFLIIKSIFWLCIGVLLSIKLHRSHKLRLFRIGRYWLFWFFVYLLINLNLLFFLYQNRLRIRRGVYLLFNGIIFCLFMGIVFLITVIISIRFHIHHTELYFLTFNFLNLFNYKMHSFLISFHFSFSFLFFLLIYIFLLKIQIIVLISKRYVFILLILFHVHLIYKLLIDIFYH